MINAWAKPVSAMGPRISPRIRAPREKPVRCRMMAATPKSRAKYKYP
jgi:hypothetical protein